MPPRHHWHVIIIAGLLLGSMTWMQGFGAAAPATPVATVDLSAGPGAQFRGDAARTGRQPGPGPDGEPGLPRRLEVGNLVNSAIAAGGVLFFGSDDGRLYAVDRATSTVTWSFTTGGPVASTPAFAGGVVYVGSTDQSLYAVDAATGDERWVYDTDGAVISSPTIVDGIVYVGSDDRFLHAVDAMTGALLWRFETNGEVRSSPAVAGETVYVGSMDGSLYAINRITGAQTWSFATKDAVFSSPAVDGDAVFFGSLDGALYALEATTGAERWSARLGGQVYSSPAVDADTVYVGSFDDGVYALDRESGDDRWVVRTNGDVFSSPALVDGTVYIGGLDQSVRAIATDTGAETWTIVTGGAVYASPLVIDGAVYVGSQDAFLYEIGHAAGTSQDENAGTPAAGTPVAGDQAVVTPIGLTPVSGEPEVPAAEECKVEPRTLDALEPIAQASPEGNSDTEGATLTGESADRETVTAVKATVRELVACANAGEILRALALFTDDFLARRLSAPGGINEELYDVLGRAVPPSSDAQAALVDVQDVQVLDDGRVRALVITQLATQPGGAEAHVFIFTKVDDRWLIDDIV